MTNFEKYKDDLMKIDEGLAVDKKTKKIADCSFFNCEDCIFYDTRCYASDKVRWLCEDSNKVELTEDETNLIKLLGKMKGESYKYITRTKDGGIMLYVGKPTSHYDVHNNWHCYSTTSYFYINKVDNNTMFSNIKFGDDIYDIKNKCFIEE